MILLRGATAIMTGVVGAALLNTLLLVLFTDAPRASETTGSFAHACMVIAGIGIVMSAPAWLLFSLLLLPVVTHRVHRTGMISACAFYGAAAILGAVLIVPVSLWWGASRLLIVMAAFGGVGGLAIAICWRAFVLDPLVASRGPHVGVH